MQMKRCGNCILGLGLALLAAGCSTTRIVNVSTEPTGATLRVDGIERGQAPQSVVLAWDSAQSLHRVEASLPDHDSQIRMLTGSEAKARAKEQPWEITLKLNRLRETLTVHVVSNVEGAWIKVNGKPMGVTPMRINFDFVRAHKDANWSSFTVEVGKDGYRHKAVGGSDAGADRPFSGLLDYATAKSGKLEVPLEPVLFVRSVIAELKPGAEGMQIIEQKVLSQVGDIESEPKVGGATKITDFELELVKKHYNRIAVAPDSQKILYSLPNQVDGSLYFNLWEQRGRQRGRTRVTDAAQQDIEATVSPDGKWLYFSSDRLAKGRYNVWRAQSDGRGGLTKITDSPSSIIDTEVAVAPDNHKIAYTSWLRGLTAPHIWTASADGTLPTQIRVGKNPSWSPDGSKLAYVAPDTEGNDKIWVMDADGGNPTQITRGNHADGYPGWTPDGRRIVFASNEAINAEGERNFDIWIMDADGGTPTQLTVNGSHDTRPVVTPDGSQIYFYSNRGARRTGEPAMQIWRIDIPPAGERAR